MPLGLSGLRKYFMAGLEICNSSVNRRMGCPRQRLANVFQLFRRSAVERASASCFCFPISKREDEG